MRARNTVLISLCVSVLSLSAGCSDSIGPVHDSVQPMAPVIVEAVTLSPAQATLSAGAHVAITATPMGQNGKQVTVQVKWTSSDPKIATVSDSGDVMAVAPGNAVITASVNGAYAAAPVTVVEQAAAESLTVAPQKADVMVGKTVQLSVTVGGQTPSQDLTWESSNTAVASVSSAGLVTGIAAGIASIRAKYQGQTAAAAVTVLVPAPTSPPSDTTSTPPPSDTASTPTAPSDGSGTSVLWSHQPSQLLSLTSQPWNSIVSLGWKEYDINNHVTVVPDATVPTGDSNVLQFFYPQGFSGGGYGPGLVYYMMSKSEMYMGFYWKMSPNWQGHTSNVNKMFYLYQREGDNRGAVLVVCYGRPGGPYHLEISNEASDGGRWWTQNVNNVQLVPGQWYKMELHLRRSSTDAAPDGLVEWWVDGQLAARYTSAKLRGASFSEIHIDPVWGGVDKTISKTHDDYQRFGRIYVSGR